MRADYHIHTTFSDGENSPREMILAAIDHGLERIGISDHSFTAFDKSYCMDEDTSPYIAEINALKQEFDGQIRVLCGVEQDYYSAQPDTRFDYVIGSVHYIKVGDEYIPVDESAKILKDAADKYFCGDIYALAEHYFRTVSRVVYSTGADIIGHFDLISLFAKSDNLLDLSDKRYRAAWRKAVDELLKTGKPFERNWRAYHKGKRCEPYPSNEIEQYILSKGGRLIDASDSHSAHTVGIF